MDKLFDKFPVNTLTTEQEVNAKRHICPKCNMVSLLHQVIYEYGCMKKCYICQNIVVLAPRGETMKYKTGDRVYLKTKQQEGILVHSDGSKQHPYYIDFDGGKDADFFAEDEIEPSKVPMLSSDMIDKIIVALHNYGTEVQPHAFGLPIYNDGHVTAMRDMIKGLLAPPIDVLPERREHDRVFTELDKKIAEDAMLFEEKLGVHPERTESDILPWRWRYVSDTIQKQFREYCNDSNNKSSQTASPELPQGD